MRATIGRGAARRARKVAALAGVAAYGFLHAPAATEPAVADGDTRTLTFVNNHTNETGSFTYRVNGAYDQAVLDKLNWFMRDWRLNEQTRMDPRLFDIVWEVYREASSSQPVDVLSAYRSPQTNAMLRRRSRLVASKSQHMLGKAIDAHFLDLSVARARDVAMRMQEGGVGFYPIGSTPWVHIDSGTVRYWPRMSRAALARLFPDGKTVFIPADGQPMAGYEEARAMIESRGGDVQTASASGGGGGGGLLGFLFGGPRGGGEDDAEDSGGARVIESAGGAAPSFAMGRGGAPAMLAGADLSKPAAPPPPAAPAPPPPPALPEPPVVAAPTAPVAPAPPGAEATVALADPAAPVDAPAADEADDAPAPLPPRRPASLLADFGLAPVPPPRPSDLVITEKPGATPPDGDDLIASLIERKALPSAIVKGVKTPPKSALALTADPARPAADPEALSRARALTPPPIPPSRPHQDSGVTRVEQTPPEPPKPPHRDGAAANPYGALVIDAFAKP